jgi:lactoylglutathione lyase
MAGAGRLILARKNKQLLTTREFGILGARMANGRCHEIGPQGGGDMKIARMLSLVLVGVVSAAATMNAHSAGVTPSATVFGVAINVADVERSAKFYRDIVGLKEVMRVGTPQGLHELVLSLSGKLGEDAAVVLANSKGAPDIKGRAGFGRVILTVADAHDLAKKAKDAGYTIVMVTEPKQPNVAAVVVFVKDPDGYTVELFQPSANPK